MRCCSLIGSAMVVGLLAVVLGLANKYVGLQPDQRFALMTTHNATVNPSPYHARNRLILNQMTVKPDQNFFQWWNFLVFDADTRDHVTIVYGVYRSAPKNRTVVRVGIAHLKGSQHVANSEDVFTLDHVRFANDFDMFVYERPEDVNNPQAVPIHSMTAQPNGDMHIRGRFARANLVGAKDAATHGPFDWDVVVYRLHGYYGSHDSEDPNYCFLTSNLFAYHSAVQGHFSSNNQLHTVTRTPRFRAYAAGSWGCELPGGQPPIQFPWTWFWLIIPNENEGNDIGISAGTGRFQSPVLLEGGQAAAALPPVLPIPAGPAPASQTAADLVHESVRYAKLFDDIPFQASASSGYLSSFAVEQADWTNFTDPAGTSLIPLTQIFRFASNAYSFMLDFRATVDQFFRCPLAHGNQVFSDFRAVGVRTHVVISRKTSHNTSVVVYDQWVNTMNAVEYAYVAPITPEALKFFMDRQ